MIKKYAIFCNELELQNVLRLKLGAASILVSSRNDGHATLFIDRDDAYKCSYPPDKHSTAPLDPSALAALSYAECISLRMMSRTTFRENYYHRQSIYLGHVRFWLSALKDLDIIIFEVIPHEVFDFVAYSCARFLGINTYFGYSFPALSGLNLSYLGTDIYNHSSHLSDVKDFNLATAGRSPANEVGNLLGEITSQLVSSVNDRPSFSRKEKRIDESLIGSFVSTLRRVRAKRMSIPYVLNSLRARLTHYLDPDRFMAIDSSGAKLNIGQRCFDRKIGKFIYFPLHYQPEASTSPIGGYFEDQSLVIEALSYFCRINHYRLLLKIHPRQHSNGLSLRLIRTLENLEEHVVLMHRDFPTQVLIDEADIIATVSGSVGWEAINLNKPVLLFGTRIYELLPGVYKIRSLDDLRRFFAVDLYHPVGRHHSEWDSAFKILQENLFVGLNADSNEPCPIWERKAYAERYVESLLRYIGP
jgi:hypothetical protein